jgi:DDE family transposase
MKATSVVEVLRQKYAMLKPELDERGRRVWAASESLVLGHGGLKAVVQATGLGENTVRRGRRELQASTGVRSSPSRRIRRRGGGCKSLTAQDKDLLTVLDGLVEPTTRGDPTSPLRWTCKSTRRLAAELSRQGHRVSHTKVAHLLDERGYSLQAPARFRKGLLILSAMPSLSISTSK